MLSSEPQDQCLFTVKNYESERGLSFRFSDQDSAELPFLVTGPLGKGLLTDQEQGLHVAFAAGTGILTFMDLVAFVARKALSQIKTAGQLNRSTL